MRETVWAAWALSAALWLICCVGAFAQSERMSLANASQKMSAHPGPTDADHLAPGERNPRYQVCRQDVLMLSFPLSPELNQKVTVQPDGYIALQGTGSVYVAGLTLDELASAVKKAYAGILHDPIVNADLLDFQKPFFTVLGQVGKPGQYDLRYDITVAQAIAVAGGLASTAKSQVFLYRAVSSEWAEVRELKLKDLLNGKNVKEDLHVRAGDMIFVPETFISKFKKYVPYGVGIVPQFPGAY